MVWCNVILCAVIMNRVASALERVRHLDMAAFTAITKATTQVLLPALSFRNTLRGLLGGHELWERQMESRRVRYPSSLCCAESILRWRGDLEKIETHGERRCVCVCEGGDSGVSSVFM